MGLIETSGDESKEKVAADGARGGSGRNGSGNGSVQDTRQCTPANAHWPTCSDLREAREPAVAVVAVAVAMAVSKTLANAHRPMLTGHRALAGGRRERVDRRRREVRERRRRDRAPYAK